MPEYRRIYQNGGIYFFTLVTYQRQPIFSFQKTRTLLQNSVIKVQKYHPFETIAYCYLTDHLHFLWQMPENDSDYSLRISLFKRYFTKRYRELFSERIPIPTSRIKRRESTIWQRRFWEHLIRDQEDLNRHIDYIHLNPIKHGLVKRPMDWESSSFLDYLQAGCYEMYWGEIEKINNDKFNFGE